jgi:chemotaxis protein methyltransferase CheR
VETLGRARISDAEFTWIRDFLVQRTGIELKAGKEALVVGRLDRRLRHYGLVEFAEYFRLLGQDQEEADLVVDLLTTNETYFFRESEHFDRLPHLLPSAAELAGRPVRVWSAAGSTGEEAYTIALTLADALGEKPWEVVGTDISSRVLETARVGLYPITAAELIPSRLLRAHCLKGRDDNAGLFTLTSALRSRVSFQYANLTEPFPPLGQFDVVFLRNVMIYFGNDTKRELIRRVAETLRPGGHLLIGHAESISGLEAGLQQIAPSVYRVPER